MKGGGNHKKIVTETRATSAEVQEQKPEKQN